MPGDSPDHILKQGLTALKQTDYPSAIRHFAQLSRDRQVAGSLRLKAHIGWIKALKGDGQIEQAIALCQQLVQHPQPKVQQWAIDTLAELRPPQPVTDGIGAADRSGFRPLATDDALEPVILPAPAIAPPAPATPAGDRSGFQPLEADSPPGPPAADESTAAAPEFRASPAPPARPEPPLGEPATGQPATEAVTLPAPIEPEGSLFHYVQLNQVAGDVEDAPPAPPPGEPLASDPPEAEPPPAVITWQSEERLTRPQALPSKPSLRWQAWVSQGIAAIATFWLGRALMQLALSFLAIVLTPFSRVLPIPLGWRNADCTGMMFLLLVGLLLASPWLLDWLLQTTAGLKPLSLQRLQQTHSESCRLLRRLNQRQGWLMPLVQELPTSAPLMFSYGWLPRYSRIVVSRGLLNQLTDAEVATLIGYELNHLKTWTLPWMSLVAALLQLCHQGYWQTAQWGDRQTQPLNRFAAAVGMAVCYGLFWLFRKVNVLAARSRVLLSDRQAVVWTGDPNALMRALVKLETGIATAIIETGYTPPLIESTDLLTPLGYEAAIGLGSLFPQVGFLSAIAWDIHNPYRRWLSLNSSHPGLGERLRRLTSYAVKWRLTPALPLPEFTDTRKAGRPQFGTHWGAFLLQISPYLGPFVGVAGALVLWFLGGVFEPLGLRQIGWLYGDRSVLWGSLLLGLGMGIMVRINPYFPDITAGNRFKHPPLPSLYADPLVLPTVSQPVRLTGKLLGRSGMANWLCQDLILQTSTGLLKLHFFSAIGPVGNLLLHPRHPSTWVGRPLEVQGWYRRGAIAWLDVESFLTNGKVVTQGHHPLWSVALCLSTCVLGLLILIRG